MPTPKLGKLVKVDPRQVWANEARDFTPWLQRNIDRLSEVLGLDLELVESEVEVGDFSADLLAKHPASGRVVVIENQLGPTDHDHLGKLLTYAAGTNAGVAVWVSTEFREEHKQVLEWLNSVSSEDQLFFAVQVEVLKVDDSPPAVNFVVAVKPSNWIKQQRSGKRPSKTAQAYQDFFTKLLHKVKRQYPGFTAARIAFPQNWFSFPAGRSGYTFLVGFTRGSRFKVELAIDTPDQQANKDAFDALLVERDVIEQEIGLQLSWERLDDRRMSRIAIYTNGNIRYPADQLEQLQDWAVDMLGRFDKAFRHRITALP